ncbi:MAG: YidC/Oxa1 family rane protein insertase [Pseudonocardiales bacterium]|nr:YidC/Oxa1 family rane protein insertase [Pseudonocardiales bacterium]
MLDFLYIAVSWVLLRWHSLFTFLGLDKSSGLNWSLSIVFLVVTARLLLFRLFIKQVHYQRHMQEMQPKISALREKYKGDRAEMNRQMMKLQQDEGFNPLAGCLPMFLQLPVFLGLFHVLRHLSNSVNLCNSGSNSSLLTLYTFSHDETCAGAKARLFGSPLAASFHDSSSVISKLGGDPTTTRWVIAVLLVISAAATMATQLLVRASATVPPEGTAATVQKLMLYVIPIGVLASGLLFNFPLGVLLYWFTSNLWTLGQQAYIGRFHPHTPKEVPVVGEVGRTLAPRPGQRPARSAKSAKPTTSRPSPTSGATTETATAPLDGAAGPDTPGPARTSAPRPGQRPSRPGGKRPPGRKPSQAKKRR